MRSALWQLCADKILELNRGAYRATCVGLYTRRESR
jgi:hypothetical protein